MICYQFLALSLQLRKFYLITIESQLKNRLARIFHEQRCRIGKTEGGTLYLSMRTTR
jgi:hypothetical protein